MDDPYIIEVAIYIHSDCSLPYSATLADRARVYIYAVNEWHGSRYIE